MGMQVNKARPDLTVIQINHWSGRLWGCLGGVHGTDAPIVDIKIDPRQSEPCLEGVLSRRNVRWHI
jgi:hypothetical protein